MSPRIRQVKPTAFAVACTCVRPNDNNYRKLSDSQSGRKVICTECGATWRTNSKRSRSFPTLNIDPTAKVQRTNGHDRRDEE